MSSEFLRKTNVKDKRPRLAESAPRKAGAPRRFFSRPLRTGLTSAAPAAQVRNCCKIFCSAERPRRWAHLSEPSSQNPHPSENEESGTRKGARPATRRRERLRHPPLRWFGMTAKKRRKAGGSETRPYTDRANVCHACDAGWCGVTLVGVTPQELVWRRGVTLRRLFFLSCGRGRSRRIWRRRNCRCRVAAR